MKIPEFTQQQKDWIFYRISQWYFMWKHKITQENVPHRLNIAKEQLKTAIFPEICINCKENAVIWEGLKFCRACIGRCGVLEETEDNNNDK